MYNLINHPGTNKIHLCIKDLYEAKYQYLIKKDENVSLKHNDPKAFTEYSNDMDDVYKNIGDYNWEKECIYRVWWYDCSYGS